MLSPAETNLVVTNLAKQEITSRLRESWPFTPIAALLLAQDPSAKTFYWQVAYYDRRVAEGPDFQGAIIQSSGLEFVLPQENLIEHVSSAQLDWDGSQFTLTKT